MSGLEAEHPIQRIQNSGISRFRKDSEKRAHLLPREGCATRPPRSISALKGAPPANEFSYRFNRRGEQLEMFGMTVKNLVGGREIALCQAHGFEGIGDLEPLRP